MSVPAKYRAIGDFHEYYSGARIAPYLTLFVGGNHEASSYLRELYYGGWVAPNIYYLGAANVVNLGGLRIVGLSGIWNGRNYNKPHFERVPYGQDELRSVYHVREWDVRKLLQVKTQVDVGISHDWPRGVEWMGDWKKLFRKKDLFEADARNGTLGSQAARYVLNRFRPGWWFSAHLHCKFAAVVRFGDQEERPEQMDGGRGRLSNGTSNGAENLNEIDLQEGKDEEAADATGPVKNEDEIDLDMDDEESEPVVLGKQGNEQILLPRLGASTNDILQDVRAQLPASFAKPEAPTPLPFPQDIRNQTTQFLALDKCLPHRQFLQLLEVSPLSSDECTQGEPLRLSYDKEWLAITRVFAAEGDPTANVPRDKGEAHYASLIAKEEQWVEENLVQVDRMTIPSNFELTAPVYDPTIGLHVKEQSKEYTNPQAVAFCDMLQIANHFDAPEEEREQRMHKGLPQDRDRTNGRDGSRGGRSHGRGGRGRGRGRGRGFR